MTVPDPDSAQRCAADASVSAWVAASAGTGKTKVLTDRILNLLLGGTPPDRILCLTFTKAAAAEMAIRLNNRLSRWSIAGDVELRDEIRRLSGRAPEAPMLEQARRLFAQVLDAPGGMRIMTIHAFCQSLLRRFPLEAGIDPQFEVMDERSAAELLAEAQVAVLERARAEPDGALTQALREITARVHELYFAELLKEVTLERARLMRLITEAGGLKPYLGKLRRSLGLAPDEDEAACLRALCAAGAFDRAALARAAEALATGSPNEERCGQLIRRWLDADDQGRLASLEAYCGVFLTQARSPRANLATKALCKRHADLEPVLRAEQARLLGGLERQSAAAVGVASGAAARFAVALLEVYAGEKRRRGLLDFDDLVLAARDLLRQPGAAPWVLFKLDGGIDHLLVDEAQDTNPEQWEVVAALAEEFFAGEGARPELRTIFAVGDAKQSIFSFQRADPQRFLDMQRHFRERVTAAKRDWREVPLRVSFRSAQAVLDLVDAVFARPEARDGVALADEEIRHEAFRVGHAGRVELWPPMLRAEAPAPPPWTPPTQQLIADAPRARLAATVAATIAHWIRDRIVLPSKGRPIRAGDVMVLVRRRNAFVTELIRELKRRDVSVAGTDRMVLTNQLAVMDLVALGRFLLLPEDDLSLATALKSPLFGLDEEQLFELAHGRDGTLWDSLRRHEAGWAAGPGKTLSELLARVDFLPPYELYAGLLGVGRGRERLIGRLGHEATDALDEFLAQALAYERAHVPSLQGFLSWLESGAVEVKRDLDQGGRDEVRVMTVHGAKGLQAPIVFLPDTLALPAQPPILVWPQRERVMLWAPRSAGAEPLSSGAISLAKLRRDQEYRRLLYVALTRAEDRLYICGWRTAAGNAGPTWYDLVQAGMAAVTRNTLTPIALPPECQPFDAPGMVYATDQTAPTPANRAQAEAAPRMKTLPAFARTPAPPEPSPPRPLIASRPSVIEPAARSPLGLDLDQQRFQRGLLIHRLLQTLPELPGAEAEAAARRFLALPAHGLEPELQDEIARETLAVLGHPEFAPLFGPGSRAEVPIVGLLAGYALSGRVDRLAVTPDEVIVVDYKTNRPPPRALDAVPAAYVQQLGAYRAALQKIYPERRVRTLLLWTDGPSIMEVGPDIR